MDPHTENGIYILKKTSVTPVVLTSMWTHGDVVPLSQCDLTCVVSRNLQLCHLNVVFVHRSGTSEKLIWILSTGYFKRGEEEVEATCYKDLLLKPRTFSFSAVIIITYFVGMFVFVLRCLSVLKLQLEFLLLHHYVHTHWAKLVLFHAFNVYL